LNQFAQQLGGYAFFFFKSLNGFLRAVIVFKFSVQLPDFKRISLLGSTVELPLSGGFHGQDTAYF
jgi:hypothetical protein